jgi:hypothetical protein
VKFEESKKILEYRPRFRSPDKKGREAESDREEKEDAEVWSNMGSAIRGEYGHWVPVMYDDFQGSFHDWAEA